MRKVLITGGAGFIGAHLADELCAKGYEVRALDNLSEQVHGSARSRPSYLNEDVELIVGDVRDPAAVRKALAGVDGVFHLAAAVGVGQSMYEIARYTDVNNLGPATLLEALIEAGIKRLVVASSMSIYGEGLYRTEDGTVLENVGRTREQLERGDWDPRGPTGEILSPVPTPESKAPSVSSIYALSKYDQEKMVLIVGAAYGVRTAALRLFNVYGKHQSLSNPYTGALAIFASRLLNGKSPMIFEDGMQQRDFVSVHDVARAFRLAYEAEGSSGIVCNIGSGSAFTIAEIAEAVAFSLGKPDLKPEITGTYRFGDIRHCTADITRAKELIGYEPQVAFSTGLREYVSWLEGQISDDRVAEATAELTARGLSR
jgi:dTDP-L-rhamnose 4-epimerase